MLIQRGKGKWPCACLFFERIELAWTGWRGRSWLLSNPSTRVDSCRWITAILLSRVCAMKQKRSLDSTSFACYTCPVRNTCHYQSLTRVRQHLMCPFFELTSIGASDGFVIRRGCHCCLGRVAVHADLPCVTCRHGTDPSSADILILA